MSPQRGAHRQNRLIERLRVHKLNTLALVPGPIMYYVTGLSFQLSERPIVAFFKADGQRAIVLPELEAEKVARANGMRCSHTRMRRDTGLLCEAPAARWS